MSLKILRIEAASEKVGIPPSGIYALMREGRFPRSVPLSNRRTGFVEKEIDEWIAAKAAGRETAHRPQVAGGRAGAKKRWSASPAKGRCCPSCAGEGVIDETTVAAAETLRAVAQRADIRVYNGLFVLEDDAVRLMGKTKATLRKRVGPVFGPHDQRSYSIIALARHLKSDGVFDGALPIVQRAAEIT